MASLANVRMFPPFEKRFLKFNDYEVITVSDKLPYRPKTNKIYIMNSLNHNAQDGWRWAAGNKSEKQNFGNIVGVSKAYKFKCKEKMCTAVKYVDTLLNKCVARIYYDGVHSCQNTLKRRSLDRAMCSKRDRVRVTKATSGCNDSDSDNDFVSTSGGTQNITTDTLVFDQRQKAVPLSEELEGTGVNDIDEDNNNMTDNELDAEKVQRQYAHSEDLAQSGVRTIESSAVPTLDNKISETVNSNDQLRMMTILKERQLEHLIEEKTSSWIL